MKSTTTETSPGTPEDRLRRFLLGCAGAVCAGTLVELFFTEHLESVVQMVPFILCSLGLIAVLAVLFAPGRATRAGLRVVMGLLVLGSAYGIYEHVTHNLAFEREIRPNAAASEVVWEALHGASPLLAPGILALAGLLALAALWNDE